MANSIRIKRSASTNEPSSLLQGELANSESGSPNGLNELWVGTTGPTVFKLIRNLNGAPAEPTAGLAAATPVTGDYMVFEDTTDSQGKRVLFSATPLSIFDNDLTIAQSLDDLTDVTLTTPADASLLIYDTGTSQWRDFIMSGDASMTDGGVVTVANDSHTHDTQYVPITGGTFTGNVTLDGPVTTADYGTGGRVKDGTDVSRPVGFNVMPVYEIDASDTFDLAHNGMLWHKDANAAVTFTFAVDTDVPQGAVWTVFNDDTEDLTIAQSGTTIYWLEPGAAPTSGNLTVEQGGIVTVYKYSDTVAWAWGAAETPAVVESVTATTSGGATIAGTATNPTVGLDYLGTDNFIDVATNLEGSAIATTDTIIYHDATDDNIKKGLVSDLPFGVGSGDISRVNITAGTGLSGTVDTLTGDHTQTLDLDFSELTDMTATISGTTEFILQDGTTESRKAASEIDIEFFDNTNAQFVKKDEAGSSAWTWFIDDDSFGTASATTLPSSESVKAYVDAVAASEMTYKGLYNAATNTPALDTGSPSISIGDMYYVSVAGTFFTTAVNPGDLLIANVTSIDAAQESDWDIVVGNEHPIASETVAGIIEIANQSEVDSGASAVLAVVPSYLHNTTFDGGSF